MNKDDDFIKEVAEALYQLSKVFAKRNMTLTSVDLGSWEDGQQFKYHIDREHASYIQQGIDHRTGEMVNEGEVAGVKVRWPTIRQAVPTDFGKPKRFRYL